MQRPDGRPVRSGRVAGLLVLVLPLAACTVPGFRGRVVRASDGEPVGGAVVTLLTGDPGLDFPETVARLGGSEAFRELGEDPQFERLVREAGGWRPAFRSWTGRDGRFAFDVPPGHPPFRVEVESGTGIHRLQDEWFASGSDAVAMPVRIPVEPAGVLRGVVLDPHGSPVAGARVAAAKLEPSGGFTWDGLPRSTETESNGAFDLRGLLPGRYTLAAFADGLGPAIARRAEVRAGKSTRVSLALTTETAVAGRVADDRGSAVQGALVVVVGEEAPSEVYAVLSGAGYGRGRTDENGLFRIGSLLPGRYRAQAMKGGMIAPEWRSLEVPEGVGATGLEFVLARGREIAGRVRDASGRAEAGAQMGVFDDPGASTSRPQGWKPTYGFGTTGADGSFRLAGLGGGPYLVRAYREGVGVVEARGVDAGREDVELVLGEPLRIAGRVRDAESGEPVRRFWAIVERREWPGWSVGSYRPFLTADGTFLHRGVPAGPYALVVRAKGYLPHRVEGIEPAAAPATIEVSLRKGGVARGRVVDLETGKPVPSAMIEPVPEMAPVESALAMGTDVPYGWTWASRSGSRGGFDVSGLAPGTWRLRARFDGYAPTLGEPFTVGGRGIARPTTLAISRLGALEGVARDEDGSPLVGWRVHARPASDRRFRDVPGSAAILTDAAGRFQVEDLPPGPHVVLLAPPQGAKRDWLGRERGPGRSGATIEPGKTARADILAIRDGVRVRGRVLRGGEPVAGLRVTLFPQDGVDPSDRELLSHLLQDTTDEHGAFSIDRVPPGMAQVRVWPAYRSSLPAIDVPVAPEVEAEIAVTLPEVAGRVVRASDGEPVARAWVRFRRQGTATESDTFQGVLTDEDGRYRTAWIWPGEFFAEVEPPEAQPELASIERRGVLVSGEGRTKADFSLAPGGSAVVRVSGWEGRPASGVRVVLLPIRRGDSPPEFPPTRAAATDLDGVAQFRSLPAGSYVARADNPRRYSDSSDEGLVRAGASTDLRIGLREETIVTVRVEPPPGVWIPHFRAVFVDEGGREFRAGPGTSFCGMDDSTLQAAVPPGKYTLRVTSPGAAAVEQEALVGADRPYAFVVHLGAPVFPTGPIR